MIEFECVLRLFLSFYIMLIYFSSAILRAGTYPYLKKPEVFFDELRLSRYVALTLAMGCW